MPKDTFFNLPAEKREKIIQEALIEFENNNFDRASINQIVIRSEISKGSFYQYFEDKKDLYKYLIQLMIEKKMAYITPAMMRPFDYGFFEVIREMNQMGLKFAKDHPHYTVIGNRLLKDNKTEMYQEIMKENSGQAYAVYEHLLRKAIEKGEVRDDIDVSFTARIIFKISAELVESDFNLLADDRDEKLMFHLENFMKLIEVGISKKND